jgi:hypothetical protein
MSHSTVHQLAIAATVVVAGCLRAPPSQLVATTPSERPLLGCWTLPTPYHPELVDTVRLDSMLASDSVPVFTTQDGTRRPFLVRALHVRGLAKRWPAGVWAAFPASDTVLISVTAYTTGASLIGALAGDSIVGRGEVHSDVGPLTTIWTTRAVARRVPCPAEPDVEGVRPN